MPISLPERMLSADALTPRQIVAELDKYVVGQHNAKRAVAIALRNRTRRQKLPPELAEAHSAFAPTFSYRFDFAPRAMKWLGLDATHGFELFAVFDIADTLIGRGLTLPGVRRGLKDVTDTVQRHWLHFASQGTPLASWPKYDTDRRAPLVFDTVTTVQGDPRRERRLAWEGYRGYYGQGL